jgi:hypothetical protein
VQPVSDAWGRPGEPETSTEVSSEDEQAADELMRQLEESGFRYDHVERVEGIGANDGTSDPDTGVSEGDDPGSHESASVGDAGPEDGGAGDTAGEGGDAVHVDGAPAPGPEGGLPPDIFELAGTRLTGPEARALLHIRKQLMDHPELSGRFSEILQSAGKPPPPIVDDVKEPPEIKLPAFIDPDDETAKGIWQQVVELRARHEASERRQTEMQAEEQAARVRRDVSAGQAAFKAAHPDLSPEDLAAIYATTSANVDVGQIMANFPGDPAQGISRAYEIGARIDDRLRDKVLATGGASTQKAADAERQRKLSQLGGTSGSTANRTPGRRRKAESWAQISAQLAEEIERASN